MRRKEKQKAKVEHEEDAENDKRESSSLLVLSSDDEEANEDLSLKIVEKALRMREAKLVPNGDVLALDGDGGGDVALDTAEVQMKRKKKKVKKVESGDQIVIVAEEQEAEEQGTVEAVQTSEKNESAEASTVEMGDNIVLRKLLRGPRYFDPPDSGWGTCYNCGEGGHYAVNCTAVKRKKPCFVCGSLEHAAKQCIKARDCFICKKGGHRAKDCPEKHKVRSKSLTVCLKCGDSGHDMFSCMNSYSLDDLKEIQCYVCKSFGHLCCINLYDATPWEVSCYKCGQLGHTGLACSRLRGGETTDAVTPGLCYKCGEEGHFARECTSSVKVRGGEISGSVTPSLCYKCGEKGHFARECTSSVKVRGGETSGAATPSSCFNCGEEGHFARECTSSAKVRKRNRESSKTKSPRFPKENDYVGYRSAPNDMGKARNKKKARAEERGITTPQKSKRRGGWMTEDPGDFSPPKFKNRWRSPATPSTKSTSNIFSYSGGNHTPSSRSSKMWKGHAGSPKSQGSAKSFQHRFSASRFGNSSSDLPRRSYDWW